MIKRMREIAPIVLWIVLIAFIGTIFFAWGMDFASRKSEPVVGKVGKTEIPLRYFDRLVGIEREKMRMDAGGELPPNQSRMVPEQVLETEISRILLKKVFGEMGLSGSADEVFTYIKNNPPPEVLEHEAFQTDSAFDSSKFAAFLNQPESYENEGIRQLESYTAEFLVPMEKLRRLVEIGRIPSQAEVAYEYRRRNEKAVFEFVKAMPAAFMPDSNEITDNMVQSFYSAHPDSFNSEDQAELYFVRLPKVPTPEDEKSYYTELDDLKKRIESGELNFADEAKMQSDDETSGKQGGELGWVARGSLVPEFEAVAFALDSGKISEPVKTQFGYHLICVQNKKMQDTVEQVQVSHILRKIMPTMETIDSLEKLCDSIRAQAVDNGLIAAAAGFPGMTVDSSGLFEKGRPIGKIGYLLGAATFAFREEVGAISDLIEDENAFYVLEVKRQTKKGILPVSEIRPKVVRMLADSISRFRARQHLEAALSALAPQQSLLDIPDNDSLLQKGATDTVTRTQYVDKVGFDNAAMAVAFALPLQKRSDVIEADRAFFAVKPLWKAEIDSIPWKSDEVKRIAYSLSSADREKAYFSWYLGIKRSAKIENNLSEYYMD